MTILRRATAEMRTCWKWWGADFQGLASFCAFCELLEKVYRASRVGSVRVMAFSSSAVY